MADFNQPTTASTYANFLTNLKDRDLDIAKQMDSSSVTVTNPVSGMKRWNPTNKYWEQYNGTTWVAMATKYAIDVETVDGCTVSDNSAASTTVLWTSDKINTFAGNYYTKTEIGNMKANYVLKNGENGALTLGTNDANSVTLETNNAARVTIGGAGNVTVNAPTSGVALSVAPFTGSDAITATGQVTGTTLKSTVAIGTAPLTVTSTTAVTNLNADMLDGNHASAFSVVAGSSSITTVGEVGTGTWKATAIGAAYGGTGQTGYTIGDLLYAPTATTVSKLSDVDTGNALISGGVGVAPSYGKIGLTTHISGTLPVGNGGTGTTTLTGLVKGNGTGAFTAAVAGTDYVTPTGSITGSSGSCTGNAVTATSASSATYAASAGTATTVTNVPAATSTTFGGLKASLSGTILTLSSN